MKVSKKVPKGWAIFEGEYLIAFDNKIAPVVDEKIWHGQYKVVQVDYSRRFIVVKRIW